MSRELALSLNNSFRQVQPDFPPSLSTEELKQQLSRLISMLLDQDFEKLLQILYRIDISEEKSKAAFASDDPTAVPELLADLIIERELEKIETRRRYST